MESRENKEFFIEASSCEEADKKIEQAIKQVWDNSVKRFAVAKTEEEKQNIVQTAIKRGCIPSHLANESEEGIYICDHEMLNGTTHTLGNGFVAEPGIVMDIQFEE